MVLVDDSKINYIERGEFSEKGPSSELSGGKRTLRLWQFFRDEIDEKRNSRRDMFRMSSVFYRNS